MDHEPRHGGTLLMVGDSHVEIVERGDVVEVFPSDASRKPLAGIEGTVSFDGGAAAALEWRSYRFVTKRPAEWASAKLRLTVDGGTSIPLDLERSTITRTLAERS